MGFHIHSPLTARARWVAAGLAGVALFGCGGGGAGNPPRDTGLASVIACRAPVDAAVRAAVTEYIKGAKPKPERFLMSTAEDALGPGGVQALQDRGPTYLFPDDPIQQSMVRAQLHDKGDYTTLLVRRRSANVKDTEASVALDGQYVGGAEDGKAVAPRTFHFFCQHSGDSTLWRLKDSPAEPHA